MKRANKASDAKKTTSKTTKATKPSKSAAAGGRGAAAKAKAGAKAAKKPAAPAKKAPAKPAKAKAAAKAAKAKPAVKAAAKGKPAAKPAPKKAAAPAKAVKPAAKAPAKAAPKAASKAPAKVAKPAPKAPAPKAAPTVAKGLADKVAKAAKAAGEAVTKPVKDAGKAVAKMAKAVGDQLDRAQKAVTEPVEKALKPAKHAVQAAKDKVEAGAASIAQTARDVGHKVTETASKAGETANAAVEGAKHAAQKAAHKAAKAAGSQIAQAAAAAAATAVASSPVGRAVAEAAATAGQAVAKVATTAIQTAESMVDAKAKQAPAKPKVPQANAGPLLAQLSTDYWEFMLQSRPQLATYLGDHRYDDRLPDVGPGGRAAERAAHQGLIERLKHIDPDGLALEDKLTFSALQECLEMGVVEHDQKLWQWEVDQLSGPQVWFLEILNTHPLRNEQDFENLIARMNAYPTLIDQYMENLRQGIHEGRLATQIATDRVMKQMRAVLAHPAHDHPLAEATKRTPSNWAGEIRDRMAGRIVKAIATSVNPAQQRLLDWMEKEYAPRARMDVGAHVLPDGLEMYDYLIRRHTTSRLTAHEIHQIGLDEMASIREELRRISVQMGHQGDLSAFLTGVRSNPKNLAGTREAVLKRYQRDFERAMERAPEFFARLPKAECVIKPLEEFREKDAPAAYYYGPAEDGSRPGVFYANTYKPETRPLHTATSLTAHEAVPGHHLQVALAMELKQLPAFRRHGMFTAYVEGWALYAERLADEMGLYEDLPSRIGMLTDQGLRACRLVVDTGMHAIGWTRDQAIEYMRENLAMRDNEIINEIDRYIVWPGQALAYKIGQREISRLRGHAERQLGNHFDIRGFHTAVLEHGALPLTTLELAVSDWVRKMRG